MTGFTSIIAVAGANGDLGGRIVKALVARGAAVLALVRPDLSAEERVRIEAMGARLACADPSDMRALAAACAGVACVVSALSGLRPVMIDRQSVLLDAAVAAGVPRFIPSNFSEDFTRTPPGSNRNLDLRREFMARGSGAASSDVDPQRRLHGHAGRRDAADPEAHPSCDLLAQRRPAARFHEQGRCRRLHGRGCPRRIRPRMLRIAGDTVTAREIARILTGLSGASYKPLGAGGIGALGAMIQLTRLLAPQRDVTFPPWQGMQYMRDMFSGAGKLHPLDNNRYPDLRWIRVADHLSRVGSW